MASFVYFHIEKSVEMRFSIEKRVNTPVEMQFLIEKGVNTPVEMRFSIEKRVNTPVEMRFSIEKAVNTPVEMRFSIVNPICGFFAGGFTFGKRYGVVVILSSRKHLTHNHLIIAISLPATPLLCN